MFGLWFKKSICDQLKKPIIVFQFSIFAKKKRFSFSVYREWPKEGSIRYYQYCRKVLNTYRNCCETWRKSPRPGLSGRMGIVNLYFWKGTFN
jgi:hypothetical protein